jgi:hypothetical protein
MQLAPGCRTSGFVKNIALILLTPIESSSEKLSKVCKQFECFAHILADPINQGSKACVIPTPPVLILKNDSPFVWPLWELPAFGVDQNDFIYLVVVTEEVKLRPFS